MTATKPNGTPITYYSEERIDFVWSRERKQWIRVVRHFKVLNANEFLAILRDNETAWYSSKQYSDYWSMLNAE